MNYFIGLACLLSVCLSVWIYKHNFKTIRFWLSAVLLIVGFYGFGTHMHNVVVKQYSEITNTLINDYESEIDSLKNKINTLSTDTITINEWKYYGDTIQYLGKDSVIMTYPVKYYRLIVTANEQTKNQTLSIESEFYNDTIIKTIN